MTDRHSAMTPGTANSGSRGLPRPRPTRGEASSSPGLILVDKPAGMTSHDVVSRMRRLAGTRRVGHAGTLDPAATGLLILGIDHGTKLLQYVMGSPKRYEATIRLGIATTTDDAEGAWTGTAGALPIDPDVLDSAIDDYRGSIMQVPSSVSAIKVDGKRAYAIVREGRQVALAARSVSIPRFEVVSAQRVSQVRTPAGEVIPVVDVDVVVECSSGTYIRALARDLGMDLDQGNGPVGGHLTALRRTQIGPWSVATASTLDGLSVAVEGGEPLPVMSISAAAATLFPLVQMSEDATEQFRHGQAPRPESMVELPGAPLTLNPAGDDIAAVVAADDPTVVRGLVRRRGGATLDVSTVTVFPEGQ